MAKSTRRITLELPEEFIALCASDQVEPEFVLRGFIADLCGLISWQNAPRSDGYNSNGSDERMYAQQYYERVGYPYWHRLRD
ncbi:hypothetical protein [Pseudomarimonas arenosa]|uniref:Uncharacterized protein n=1 Tax=Pseudomarimonas arenosa TaxID=2774145 RepID=A0AAW3ZRL8_9GAMM|nr:hypothetical protein [Pseudomarimonas arenosa]MBD8528185.1 hypothetical protein [Pseudomarimonas arenosa]